ncbi:MAG TPA: hypothetical protein VK900_11495, partial [Anaerolineales bacterium]|nr:hypothetical protein [Anaerolineales bacterium]
NRSTLNCLWYVVMPVGRGPSHRHEQVTGLDQTAVNGDSPDGNIGDVYHAKRQREFGKEMLK